MLRDAGHAVAVLLQTRQIKHIVGLVLERLALAPIGRAGEHASNDGVTKLHVAAEAQIFVDRCLAEHRGALKGAANAGPRHQMRAHLPDIVPEHLDAAAGRLGDTAEDIEQCRLAGAIGADNAEDFA